MSNSVSYPLCQRFGLSYSSFEDRLILTAELPAAPITVFLTRNLVVKIISRLLTHLPSLTKLDKTPRTYWQEALSISHQQALKMQDIASQTAAQPSVNAPKTFNVEQSSSGSEPSVNLFLATQVDSELKGQKLLLGLKGLPLPDAITVPNSHRPILALALETEHLHQLLQLFLNKSTEAEWRIPFDLPWMVDKPTEQSIHSH